jgi:type VI secretion system protein ImpD
VSEIESVRRGDDRCRPLPAPLTLARSASPDTPPTDGVRERLVAEVARLARAGAAPHLDAWLEGPPELDKLARWFGGSMPPRAQEMLLAIDRDIAAIDELLSEQINAILHARAFQRLEASWRGLNYLAEEASKCTLAKVRVLSVSWIEIVRDLERASDFDRSQLFEKIYTQEFGTLGGEPFGLLLGDYEVQHRPSEDRPTDDVAALQSLAAIAAAAFAPLILGAAPRLFEVASFHELGRGLDAAATFQQIEYQRWQSMRNGDDLRFIGLVVPHILLRIPYRDCDRRYPFRFTETLDSPGAQDYLWGNASFAFGAVVVRAFGHFGWFADIRGAPLDEIGGGMVLGLPVASFGAEPPHLAPKPPLDCALTDAQELDLARLGFMALRSLAFTGEAVFYGNLSLRQAVRMDRAQAGANVRLASMLQYILCVSRFAHFVKVLGRSYIGSTRTAEDCQRELQNWLAKYCNADDSASREAKARQPLREATVEVREVPGKAGSYACTVFLRPHFQLDDIATGFRLTTQIAPASVTA